MEDTAGARAAAVAAPPAAAAPAAAPALALAPEGEDEVMRMQDELDSLALAMFDAIRFLPQEGKVGGEEWEEKVGELGKGVCGSARRVMERIETLRGANRTQAEQLAELRELGARSKRAREALKCAVSEAQSILEVSEAELRGAADAHFVEGVSTT